MNQLRPYLLISIVCAALAGCGDQSVLTTSPLPEQLLEQAKKPDQAVSLKGHFKGTGGTFSGTLTHLGRFEGSFDATTNTAVWTAANGDTVTNQTTSFVLTEQVSPNVFRYLQELTITGGSGRFTDASGRATVTGLYDLNTGSYDGQLEGYISQLTVGK